MVKVRFSSLLGICILVTGCAFKTPVVNQYKLESFSSTSLHRQYSGVSLLISQPEAVGGYQSEQIFYTKKPYELEAFAHNVWISTPANMLFPLMMQSLQNSGYFYAVTTTPYADKADYRLDTQLIELQQNFLVKPSQIQLIVKVVLTHMNDNRVIASQIISQRVTCPQDTPYGGVVAANQAVKGFTANLSNFVITRITQDNHHLKAPNNSEKTKTLVQ